jgi:predicted N-acyltransferase
MTDGVTAELLSKVSEISADQWDALNPRGNPFVSHAFLSALEHSGSVGPGMVARAATDSRCGRRSGGGTARLS